MEQTQHVGIPVILTMTLAVVLPIVMAATSRALRDGKWPFRLATASLVPPLAAVFIGVRVIISAFGEIDTSGSGGVGAAAAAMWEAYRPVLYAAYTSLGLLIVVSLILLKTTERDCPGETPARAISAIVACILITAIPLALMLYTTRFLLSVIDPHSTVSLPLSAISQRTSGLLIATAGISAAVSAILLLVAFAGPLLLPGVAQLCSSFFPGLRFSSSDCLHTCGPRRSARLRSPVRYGPPSPLDGQFIHLFCPNDSYALPSASL